MIPEKLLDLIRRFEGLRLKPYLCSAGVPTIGYGHTGKDVSMNMPPITIDQAETMLIRDAGIYYQAAGNLSPILWLSDENKHTAIADFCYNLGVTRYKSSTLKKLIDTEDWGGAAIEIEKWVYGGGKRLPGLIARRQEEARLLKIND